MKIAHKKVSYQGIEFHSQSECDYYKYLQQQPNIIDIELQPTYTLIKPFQVECTICRGVGKVPSPKTDRLIQCKKCDGDGWKNRQPWTYTADFLVTYSDGYQEVIDVKPGTKFHLDKTFPNKKKMWEKIHGKELIVVKKIKGQWVRK